MRPMREFDPDWPARLHDRLNDKTIDWLTGWAPEWRARRRKPPPRVVPGDRGSRLVFA